MELFFKGSYDYRMHLASFNGLTLVLYELTLVEQDQDPFDAATFGFAVIVPLTKQRHDLPPISIKIRPDLGGPWYAAGIGFDDSTNTLKTVFSIAKDPQFEVLCTMVHSSRTGLWREIAQIPTDPICGEGVYGHGRLHWLSRDGELEIIKIVWFNVKTEEFGLTDPPKPTNFYEDMEQLADLNGEVGFGYASPICIKLWILKQEEEWVLHCCFDPSLVLSRYNGSYVDVLGCWNKDGDILLTCNQQLFVYNNLESGDFRQVLEHHGDLSARIQVYQSSLFSLTYSIKEKLLSGRGFICNSITI
ncbi:putative F-box associated interaction domain-containing protein [Helianthus debilis subsp. tardiflorus]